MKLPPHVAVIDPAVEQPEIDGFNHLVGLSPVPLTYHLPGLQGLKSLERENENLLGIILLGSLSSVNDRLPWQESLEGWLMPKLQAGTPTLGCCYGHQMLAFMFGGKISYRTPDQKKLTGFREVELTKNSLWGDSQKGHLYVSHNEVVTHVPSSLKITAKSDDVQIDGLAHTTLPIWTFQPHPEATQEFAEVRGSTGTEPATFNFGYSLLKRFLEFCVRNR